jgi:hypothetical protein
MNTDLPRFELDLPHRAIFTVPDADGIAIECEGGSVWVTLDDDPRDIVLAAGERFTGTSHRRALVSALQDARIAIAVPRPALSLVAERPVVPSRWRLGRVGAAGHGLSPA